MVIVTVGIDLAKNVFTMHGVDETGKPALVRAEVPRAKLLELIANLPPCLADSDAHGLTCIAARQLLFGKKIRDDGVGMSVTHPVLCLEEVDKFHVFEQPRLIDDFEPVVDWLPVCFFDGRKVRSRTFDLWFSCHHSILLVSVVVG